jgi:hypothetical protein
MAQNSRHEVYPGEVLSRAGATAMDRALTLSGCGAPAAIAATTVSLVVMEPGSEWPRHIGHRSNLVAFSQRGEKLLQRTREELHTLRRGQQNVRVAVLACNGETGGEAGGYRAQIARTLLAAVTGTTFGRLVLSASDGVSLGVRQELLALAGALSEQLRGTTATVSLRFTEAP